MSERRPAGKLLTALTLGRIALIPVIAISFMASPAVTAVSLLAFMFADLFDGVVARREGADGPSRRAWDSTVDRIAIDVGLVAAAASGAMAPLLLVGFLARDLYCAGICAVMIGERRVAIKADLLYQGLNCGLAGWALAAPFLSSGGRSAAAAALFLASLVVAADLTRSVQRVRSAPDSVRNLVVSATRVRRGDFDWKAGREDARTERATFEGYKPTFGLPAAMVEPDRASA
jgi:phosphatidylglycerophosphate synthase